MDHHRPEGEKNNDNQGDQENHSQQNQDHHDLPDWFKVDPPHGSSNFSSPSPPMPPPENRLPPTFPHNIPINPYHPIHPKTAFLNTTAYDPTLLEADFSRLNLSTPLSRSNSYGLGFEPSFPRNLSDSSLTDLNLQRMRVESTIRRKTDHLYMDPTHGFFDWGAEELLDLDGCSPYNNVLHNDNNINGEVGYGNMGGLTRWNNRLNQNGFYEVGGGLYRGAPSNNLNRNGFSSVYGSGYGAPLTGSNRNSFPSDMGYGAPSNLRSRNGFSSAYTGFGAAPSNAINRNGFQSNTAYSGYEAPPANPNRNGFRRRGRSDTAGSGADKSRSPSANGNNNRSCSNNLIMSPVSECLNARPLEEWRGNMVFLAKDQHGYAFLKKKIEENKREEIEMIFMEVKDHVRELMVDQYGNYPIQKIFEVANEDHMTQMLLVVVSDEIMSICVDSHGTRAMQKMLEHLTTPEQVSLVMTVIIEIALVLSISMTGYHVIERCLKSFTNEQNRKLVYVIADNCADISMNQAGCHVVQLCVSHSEGEPRDRLISGIIANSLVLSENIFGNYVVQYVLEMRKPLYMENIMAQLAGSYVSLSMNKYGSCVVERCLQNFNEEQATRIIREIIDSRNFLMVLQDPFGNYVTQTALEIAKGSLRRTILVLIQHHYPYLHSHPHGKRVLAKTKGSRKHHHGYDYRR